MEGKASEAPGGGWGGEPTGGVAATMVRPSSSACAAAGASVPAFAGFVWAAATMASGVLVSTAASAAALFAATAETALASTTDRDRPLWL